MPHLTSNQQTVASYEAVALEYAESTAGAPSPVAGDAFGRLADLLPEGGSVLELGSGPGWDADHLESLGLTVRRTDATGAFCDFQRARGKQADRLDAAHDPFTDPLWPHYDAIVAQYVLQHLERDETRRVLAKSSAALRVGGAVLFSLREGTGARWEVGEPSGRRYRVILWSRPAFYEALRAVDLVPRWAAEQHDSRGDWMTVIAVKTA